jgi:ferredoxin-NAD(P)+ reductase (naphthalene dioxygenase ferredoxin-specific)
VPNPIHVYFGARSADDVYDADRLRQLAADHPQLTVHVVVASGPAQPGQRSGLVTDLIAQDHPVLAGWRAYLCGSPAMVDALNLVVTRLGVAPEHVHADAFYPSGV